MKKKKSVHIGAVLLAAGLLLQSFVSPLLAFGRELEYKGKEVRVAVLPGEPTQINFPDTIQGGFKRNLSSLHIDRKDRDLIIFASEGLPENGEAIIVRLKNGQSYSLRIQRAENIDNRDDVITILDDRKNFVSHSRTDKKAYEQGEHGYAPPAAVTGLLRELVLTEFGKAKIPGYRASTRYNGDVVLNDGSIEARINNIYMGPQFWGYILEVENKLDQTVQLNPATFRLDGTRAISMKDWELKGRPITVEQQIAKKHITYVYIVTIARKLV